MAPHGSSAHPTTSGCDEAGSSSIGSSSTGPIDEGPFAGHELTFSGTVSMESQDQA